MLVVTPKRYPLPTKQVPVIKATGKGPIDYTPESTINVDFGVFIKSNEDRLKLKELKATCLTGSKLKTLIKIVF